MLWRGTVGVIDRASGTPDEEEKLDFLKDTQIIQHVAQQGIQCVSQAGFQAPLLRQTRGGIVREIIKGGRGGSLGLQVRNKPAGAQAPKVLNSLIAISLPGL